jgi:deoxyribonuclease V
MRSASSRSWPATAEELIREQERLGAETPPPWSAPQAPLRIAACAVCFGRADDMGHAAAALWCDGATEAMATARAPVAAPFEHGLLALREGPLLESAVRSLLFMPDVLLVQAAGRDHPRRAGLALHLGAVLGIPTAGITTLPFRAQGATPGAERGSRSALMLGAEQVGFWLRTRAGTQPLAVHAGWRTDAATAADVVLAAVCGARFPEPVRLARAAARAHRFRYA